MKDQRSRCDSHAGTARSFDVQPFHRVQPWRPFYDSFNPRTRFYAARNGRAFAFGACCITFRVAEPAAWARHLRLCPSANAVTGQGLGVVSGANGAGNPVLGDGRP